MKKILKALLGVILVILCLVAFVLLFPFLENARAEEVRGTADWMNKLDGELLLNEISLPGAHDCATEYVQLAFFSKCQSRSIAELLDSGVRYLDVRLGINEGRMQLMHGFTLCKSSAFGDTLYLDSVLEDCYAFLDLHYGETILFVVKQEHGDESVAEFQTLLNAYIAKDPEHWLLTDTLPKLSDCRGKLVLLRRYFDEAGLGAAAGINVSWVDQPGSSDTTLNVEENKTDALSVFVQDRYEYGVADKWNAFTEGLDMSADNASAVRINFLSTKGTLTYGNPYYFAVRLNKMLMKESFASGQGLGWVVCDFCTPQLCEKIYSQNYNCQ